MRARPSPVRHWAKVAIREPSCFKILHRSGIVPNIAPGNIGRFGSAVGGLYDGRSPGCRSGTTAEVANPSIARVTASATAASVAAAFGAAAETNAEAAATAAAPGREARGVLAGEDGGGSNLGRALRRRVDKRYHDRLRGRAEHCYGVDGPDDTAYGFHEAASPLGECRQRKHEDEPTDKCDETDQAGDRCDDAGDSWRIKDSRCSTWIFADDLRQCDRPKHCACKGRGGVSRAIAQWLSRLNSDRDDTQNRRTATATAASRFCF